jgi:hypothetical protein
MKRAVQPKFKKSLVLVGDGPDVEFWLPLLLAARDTARAAADPLLTVQQAAQRWGCDDETVRLWCRSRQLGFFDKSDGPRGRYRMRLSELRARWMRLHGAAKLPAGLR